MSDDKTNDKANESKAITPALLGPDGMPPAITHKDLAKLWDIVIRAHYLAHELGDPCARSGLAAARMALSLSEVLSAWAGMFGEELEALEKRAGEDGA